VRQRTIHLGLLIKKSQHYNTSCSGYFKNRRSHTIFIKEQARNCGFLGNSLIIFYFVASEDSTYKLASLIFSKNNGQVQQIKCSIKYDAIARQCSTRFYFIFLKLKL
jgi:hypothetical protein